jgi:HAD superfamily hydrolase (TIGR01458 family)
VPHAFPSFRGALIDVDGTLLDGEAAIPGAAEAIERLRGRGIPFRLTTNTTRRPRGAIAAALAEAGIAVGPEEIVIPAGLARRRIVGSGKLRTGLMVPEPCLEDLAGIVADAERPDWVVVGDLGRDFTFERMNEAFRWLRAGAALIALHKNRFWHAGERGIVLDAGPFVTALEFATGRQAEVVGKPAPGFFALALDDLGLPAGDVLCVGDSLENDCIGAARAGCRTALVRTGLFDPGELARAPTAPDLILDSIADLMTAGGRG